MTYGKYPDLSKVKKILIVKMRHHGDVLLTSPVFSCLQHALPHASIDALLYQDTLPMLEGHPAVSRFILYDKKCKKLPLFQRIYHEISLYRQVVKGGYDLVINLTEGDRGAFAAMLSKAFCTVGLDRGGKRFLGSGQDMHQ
jgi:heptosyltransferase-3